MEAPSSSGQAGIAINILVAGMLSVKMIAVQEFAVDAKRDESDWLIVVAVEGLTAVWDDHPQKGRRAMVQAVVRGRRCLVVLYPVDHPMGDVWNLGSIYEKPA